jgi:enoyl-CoA hydratase
MNTGEPLRTDKKNGIAIITLNAREGLNILDWEVLERLSETLDGIDSDSETRAVIITGEKNFSAGADIKKMRDMTPSEAETFSKLGHRICNHIESTGKPIIAAIKGYALGGGCEIALACDMRISAENARLGQPEINIGLIPGFGGTQRLARLVGVGKAKELILTGKIIDAKEAELIGLVNHTVKSDELMKRSEEMAAVIARSSPLVIKAAKRLINESQRIQKGFEREIISFSECFGTKDHLEGIEAFMEKRAPIFKGE